MFTRHLFAAAALMAAACGAHADVIWLEEISNRADEKKGGLSYENLPFLLDKAACVSAVLS